MRARFCVAHVLLALVGAAAAVLVSACGAEADDPAACIDGDEHAQRYGTDCLCCHDEFGVAGSVDKASSEIESVEVTGTEGGLNWMVPNSFGNFFRHHKLTPPLTATVKYADGRVVTMVSKAPHGGCNRCHDGVTVPRVSAP
jgi:hypothetical protein